jgi:hypothetical protein
MHNEFEAIRGNIVSINVTPHSRIIEKLIVAGFAKTFPAFHVTQIALPFSQCHH